MNSDSNVNMNPDSNIDLNDLGIRLVRLENRNKLLMRCNCLLIAIFCLMVFVGWKSYSQPLADWIDCRGIVVRDSGGHTRAMLGIKANEPYMQFYDATGKPTWSAPTHFGISPTEK